MKILKKLTVLGAALCAAGFMVAASAQAGVVNSRHDVTSTLAGNTYGGTLGALAEFGTCSACHIPHGAGADKLFPSAATGALGGYYGPLCGSCHDSNAFAGGSNNIWINGSVLDTNAHGLNITDFNTMGSDGDLTSTNLKYLAGEHTADNIECLSCHDVHNQNSHRPFLLMTLETLCQECHTNRVNSGLNDTGYSNSLSTHPSGAIFTGDMGSTTGVIRTSPSNKSDRSHVVL